MSPLFRSKRRKTAKSRRRRAGSAAATRWAWLLGFSAAAVVLGIGLLQWAKTDTGKAALLGLGSDKMYGEVQAAVDEALASVLPDMRRGPVGPDAGGGATDHDWPAPQLAAEAEVRCRVVAVAGDESWWEIQRTVAAAVEPTGARILWGERISTARNPETDAPDEAADLLRLDLGVPHRPTHTLVLHRAGRAPPVRWGAAGATAWSQLAGGDGPVVALVIDDWGYSRSEACRSLLDLPAPLTLAVLPGLPYSRQYSLAATGLALPAGGSGDARDVGDRFAARDARLAVRCFVEVSAGRDRGRLEMRRREVILHFPMEPQGYPEPDPGPRALLKGMSRADVAVRLDDALATLVGARGVNNHMGSAATSDPELMKTLMAELRERGLYFVDSLTSSHSVAYDEALAAGLPAARNRIFLDYDNEDEGKIRRNLHRLVQAARSSGYALGIGHPHPATASVLAREIPRLVADGVRFVTVSEFLALQARDGDPARTGEG